MRWRLGLWSSDSVITEMSVRRKERGRGLREEEKKKEGEREKRENTDRAGEKRREESHTFTFTSIL